MKGWCVGARPMLCRREQVETSVEADNHLTTRHSLSVFLFSVIILPQIIILPPNILFLYSCFKSILAPGSLFVYKSTLSQSVPRPPIELFWTAKKLDCIAANNYFQKANYRKFDHPAVLLLCSQPGDEVLGLSTQHFHKIVLLGRNFHVQH